MNKTSASVVLAIVLDLIFACVFLLVLSQWRTEKQEITLHMNQVGMFKDANNASACKEKLNGLGLEGYSYTKDDLIIVVTSLSVDEQQTISEQKILTENQLAFVFKEVTTEGKEFYDAVMNKNMEKVMELMSK